MRRMFFALSYLSAPLLALARPIVPAALPHSAFADTEVSTNVPFTAALDASLETFSVSVTPDGTVFIMR